MCFNIAQLVINNKKRLLFSRSYQLYKVQARDVAQLVARVLWEQDTDYAYREKQNR